MVDEEILAFAALRGDESVPLRVVEPFHCSSRHKKTPPLPLMNGRWEASPTRYSLCGELSVAAVAPRPGFPAGTGGMLTAVPRRGETGRLLTPTPQTYAIAGSGMSPNRVMICTWSKYRRVSVMTSPSIFRS